MVDFDDRICIAKIVGHSSIQKLVFEVAAGQKLSPRPRYFGLYSRQYDDANGWRVCNVGNSPR